MKDWYVFIGSDEYYNYGKIINVIDTCILVRLQSQTIPANIRLYHLECLAHNEDVFFFETEDELNKWLRWCETPEANNAKFKVINFKKD